MKIGYAVLCSEGNIERTANVIKLKEQIPELYIVEANRQNVFYKHVDLFRWGTAFDGIVILEDDVKLCKDFKRVVSKIIKGHEDEVVSMFESALSKTPLHSEYRNGGRFAWNQCNYYPKGVCKKLADPKMMPEFKKYFYTKLHEPWNYPIDRYIAFVMKKYKLKYWMSVPFPVQHLSLKSNFQGRPLNRQSKFFIDDIKKENE